MSTLFDKWCEDIIDAAIAHASVYEKEIVVEVPGVFLERLTQKLQEAKEELGFTGSVRFKSQKPPGEDKH